MSDQQPAELAPGPPRHRRKSRWPGLWIAGGTAVVMVGVAATIGVLRAGADPQNAAETSPAATTAPQVGPTAGPGRPATVPPSRAPRTTTRPSSKAPAGRSATVAGVPAPPAGFSLTWADAFGGKAGAGLNRGTYRYDTGPGSTFGTGEIETMTDSTKNVFHDGDGHLVLRALHSGDDPKRGWTSGRFETQAATFGAAKGEVVRIQASIRQPDVGKADGAGYWPAFWMLGNGLRNGGTWPNTGEIDILEDVNGRSSVFGTLHCGVNPGGPCNESSGIGSGEHACAGCQTGFHTYAVEIDRSGSTERIRWFLDGRNYFTLAQSRVDAKAWASAVDHPFFIIFDLAIGGGFPDAFGGGPNADTVSGGALTIDYVAVYHRG